MVQIFVQGLKPVWAMTACIIEDIALRAILLRLCASRDSRVVTGI